MFSKTFLCSFLPFQLLFRHQLIFTGQEESQDHNLLHDLHVSQLYTLHPMVQFGIYKLMEYFTQVFRNVPNYSFFQQNSNRKLVMLIFFF